MRIKTEVRTVHRGPLVNIFTIAAVLVLLLSGSSASAQTVQGPPEVSPAVHHDVSPPLREIPPLPPQPGPPRIIPLRAIPHVPTVATTTDRVLQSSGGPLVSTTSGLNFDGVDDASQAAQSGFLVAPPDTNGAVGATQYVQWVNLAFAVFDKTTGATVFGPAAGNTLWAGFGGPCQTNNDGDIIAQYDKAANRWVMTQFSVSTTPYFQCIAVSTTSDATGTYNRYAFQMPNFPDYPKLGVWPDAYYMSFNLFVSGIFFAGAQACALDRNSMLSGAAATMQCFQQSSSVASLLPSDLDGTTAPPTGSPNYFLNFGSSSLNLWKFHVDWGTPANSTFTGPTAIQVASFTEACNGGTCIPQAGTSEKLDSLGDRLMYRLAYRNFGDHESLIVNHSVAAGTNVGIRWYEIRSPAATPSVYQQGTYAPDSNFRWMGSIAMDHVGDIAVGYSVSSSSMFPAIRYTGRVPGDPLGTLEGEASIIDGAGSQLRNLSRWGDYSSIGIDPVDDCTFWHTSEYLKFSGTFNWSTRIASFKFPSCGTTATPDFSLSATPASQTVARGNSTSYTVTVTPSGGFSGSVTLSVTGLPSGATASFSPNPVSVTSPTPGSSTMTVTTSSTTPAGSYLLTITGTSGSLAHTTTVTLVVNAPATADFSLSASPSSVAVTQGSSASYTVTLTSLSSFSGSVNLSISGVPAGATATFNPNPVSVPASGSASSTLTMATSTSTPAGTYTVTITGTSGSLSHSTTVTLVVNSTSTGDFSISTSPTTRNVTQGSSTSYTVNVSSSGGFTGDITLSVTGLPSNTAASFSPNPVTGGSGSSTLTTSTSGTTPTGSYTLTITGTNGSLSHSVNVNLNVR